MKRKITAGIVTVCMVFGLFAGVQPVTKAADGAKPADYDFEFAYTKDDKEYIRITRYNGYDTDLVLPDVNDDKIVVEIADDAFEEADTVEKVTIPASMTGDVKALLKCSNLKDFEVEEGNVSWNSQDGLLYNLKSEKVQLYGYPSGREGTAVIPDNVQEVGEYAFSNCKKLNKIVIGEGVGITEMSDNNNRFTAPNVYKDCDNLEEIEVSADNSTYKSLDGVLYDKGGNMLIAYPCKKGSVYALPDSCKEITEWAFCNSNIERVIFADNLHIIRDYAFSGSSIKKINIPGSVRSIGNAVFWNCAELTEIVFPHSIDSIVEDDIEGCSMLTVFSIPVEMSTVTFGAGLDITKHYDIYYEGTMEDWGKVHFVAPEGIDLTVHYGVYPAPGWYETVEPTTAPTQSPGILPTSRPVTDQSFNVSFVTPAPIPVVTQTPITNKIKNRYVGEQLVYSLSVSGSGQCTAKVTGVLSKNYKKIVIPSVISTDGVEYKVNSVAGSVFKNCKKLESVTIGKNISSIGNNAFRGCGKLKKVIILSSKLKSMGKNSYKGINSKAVFYLPKKKHNAYKKQIIKAGAGRSVGTKKIVVR